MMNAIAKSYCLVPLLVTALMSFTSVSYAQLPPHIDPCEYTVLHFDGTDDQLTFSNPILNGSEGTWEAWVQKEDWSVNENRVLFGNNIPFNVDNTLYLSFHSAVGLHFRYGSNLNEISSGSAIFGHFTESFTDGSWHHIAVSWKHDGGTTTLKMFIDGVVQSFFGSGSKQLNQKLVDPGLVEIGHGADGFFKGAMAEVRLWNEERSEADIQAAMDVTLSGTESGLAHYWRLDNAGSSTAADLVSGGEDAMLTDFDTSIAWETVHDLVVIHDGMDVASGETVDYGDVALGSPSMQTFFIENTTAQIINYTNTPAITIDGPDAGLFSIDQGTVTTDIGGESQQTFTVTFTSTIAGNYSATLHIENDLLACDPDYTVPLTATAKEAVFPIFSGNRIQLIREGQSLVTDVDAVVSPGAVPDNEITYDLISGGDASQFTINSGSGELSFLSPPDFENPTDTDMGNVYDLIVRASTTTGSTTIQYKVHVVDVVEFIFPMDVQGETVQGVTATYTGLLSGGELSRNSGELTIAFDQPINVAGINLGGSAQGYTYTHESLDDPGNTKAGVVNSSADVLLHTDYTSINGIQMYQTGGFGILKVLDIYASLALPSFTSPSEVDFSSGSSADVLDVEAVASGGSTPDLGLTYSLEAAYDNTFFTIDPASGVLNFNIPPDESNPQDANGDNIYELIVLASDGLSTASQVVYVEVLKSQSITFGALADVTFGDTDFALNATASSGLEVSYQSSDPSVAVVVGNMVTIVGSGLTTITASQPGDATFGAASDVQQTLQVLKADQVLSDFTLTQGAIVSELTYGSEAPTLSVTNSSGLPTLAVITSASNNIVGKDQRTGNTFTFPITLVEAGNFDVQIENEGSANYNALAQTFTVIVNKADQDVVFDPIPSKVIGDADFSLSIVNNTGLTLNYESSDEGVATVNAGLVSVAGAGSANIRIFNSGNGNYNALDVSQPLVVATANQHLSSLILVEAEETVMEFDGPGINPFAEIEVDSGLPLAFNFVESTTNTIASIGNVGNVWQAFFDFQEAGTFTLQVSNSGDAHYAPLLENFPIVVNKVDQTLDVMLKEGGETVTAFSFGVESQEILVNTTSPVPFTLEELESSPNEYSLVTNHSGFQILPTIHEAGSFTLRLSNTGDGLHNAVVHDIGLVINKAGQSITFDPLTDKVYGDADFDLMATSSSGLPIIYSSSDEEVAMVENQTLTIVGVGVVTIEAIQPGNGNFESATAVSQSFEVSKADQTISFDPIVSGTYGETMDLTALATSDLEVDFVVTSGPASKEGSQLTMTGIGQVTVEARQAGNANYNAATPISQNFNVSPAQLALTINDKEIEYGSSLPHFDGSLSGLTFDDEIIPTYSTTATQSSSVGMYEISASLTDPNGVLTNYTVQIDHGTLSINKTQLLASADDKQVVYADELPVFTGTISGIKNEDQISVDLSTEATPESDVGTYSINISLLDPENKLSNYEPKIDNGLLTIIKADQFITFESLEDFDLTTMNEVSLMAETTFGLPVAFSIVEGDGEIDGNKLIINAAGIFTIEASQSGSDNINSAPSVQISFSVTDTSKEEQSISFAAIQNSTYGEVIELMGTASSGLSLDYSIISGPATVSGSILNCTGAGTIEVEATQTGDEFYNAAAPVRQSFVAEKAELHATADDLSKTYKTENPTLTISYGGFVSGDSEADLAESPAVSTTADTESEVGNYPITINGGMDTNYRFVYTNGTLSITKAEAAISLNDLEQVADGTSKIPTITTVPEGLNYTLTWTSGAAPSEVGLHDFIVTIDETNYIGEESGILILTSALGFNDASVIIYPNPASDFVTVVGEEVLLIELIDANGKVLLSQNSNNRLDMRGITPQVLFIRLTNSKGNKTIWPILKKN